MFWVYILKNSKSRIYIGHTGNLESRIEHHIKGDSYWTSRYKDWILIYYEKFEKRGDAMKREKELKTGKGRDELKRNGII